MNHITWEYTSTWATASRWLITNALADQHELYANAICIFVHVVVCSITKWCDFSKCPTIQRRTWYLRMVRFEFFFGGYGIVNNWYLWRNDSSYYFLSILVSFSRWQSARNNKNHEFHADRNFHSFMLDLRFISVDIYIPVSTFRM